ncbi:MAG TPA: PAS domain S-box protein [Rubrobacter sp.]|nr:PAS domain S-box protein [Rubrobacter sp.]
MVIQPSEPGKYSRRTRGDLWESEERFRLLVEGVEEYAIFMIDSGGYVSTWNPGARRIKGYEAGEIVGEHFSVFFTGEDVERGHPEELLRLAASEGRYEEEGLRVRKDGSTFWANAVVTALRNESGDLRGFAKVTRDITARKKAEERERLLLREQAARERATDILESISDAFYAVDTRWRFTYVNGRAEELLGRSREELLGKNVWEEFPEAVNRQAYHQARRAMEEGVTTEFEAELAGGAWVSGRVYPSREGLSVYFRDETENHRNEEAQRFLVQASAVLSSSLDYNETLASVARLAVPTLADWCTVHFVEEDGVSRRLALEHTDPEKLRLAHELERRYPPDPDAPQGLYNVLRTREPELVARIPDELLEQVARDDRHRELLIGLGLRSYMVVPLLARGRVLGAISFISAESERRYGEADLRLAEELARRAAYAVDNARLYKEAQKEIAERRRAQEELRASRDQLEAILLGAAEGITAQDPTGKIIYANEAAARMTGFSSVQEMTTSSPDEVLARYEIRDEEGNLLPIEKLPGRRALLGEEGVEEIICFRILSTEEVRWATMKAMPIFGERGTVLMAVSILRDITESRRAKEALRRVTEAERSRIARDLHDGVLQDLSYSAATLGMLMLQPGDEKLKEQLQMAIDAVRSAAQGLREVVNGLRLEGEEGRPFTATIEALIRRNRTMARKATINLHIDERVPEASLGETGTQISHVIQEALTNARRHSGAEVISVSLRMNGDVLVAEVSDNGQGFGEGTRPGVGLESMRERAALIGGELEIKSESEQGTSVRLEAPLPGKSS